ncbi:MAG: hypothetical protein J5969_03495 [Lachnospiraceae bacterium]|nr:hypothetical protein [Lachnospiraceae bacterium]
MTWTAYLPGRTVADPRSDIKSGTRIEQYKISDQAVYFPRKKYLLLSDIRRTWIQDSTMNLVGTCGKGLPVFVVRLDHGDEKKVNLMLEKKEHAEEMIRLICEKNPSVVVEQWSRQAQLDGTAPK